MTMIVTRLRRHVREAVAASSEPQLQRGQDGATRKKAKRKKASKPGATPSDGTVRESTHLRVLIREADIRKAGDVYECTIVREGPGNPGDRNYYTRQALREAVANGLFEGLQAYLNHPTPTEERERPERDVRYLAGHFREARFVDGKLAEVRAKFVPGGMNKDGVVALIESALTAVPGKPLVGISIDGYGYAPDQKEVDGRTYNLVREVTELGSADIVTRAGAGGVFHRRLQEHMRHTDPAERRSDTSKEARMKPAKMQEKIKAAVAKLQEASGLEEKDGKRADELVSKALISLREVAAATIDEPKPKVKIREIEKPVAASESDKDKLAAENADLTRKLTEAESVRDKERSRRKDAETKLDARERAHTAARVLQEATVPEKQRREWFDEVLTQEDEKAMRKLVERKTEAREELLAELRESYGVEGVPARFSSISTPATGSDLLSQLGVDRDEYVPAAA